MLNRVGKAAVTKEVLDAVYDWLRNESNSVIIVAGAALVVGKAVATDKVIGTVTSLFFDGDWHVRRNAVFVLGELGKKPLPTK